MRTTITLDDEAATIVATRMRTRNLGFKQAVNELIKAGAGDVVSPEFETPVFDLGHPRVDLTKAMRQAGDLEDEHLVERAAARRVKLVDANVMLHAVNTATPDHRVARGWLDGQLSAGAAVGFDWVALLAFLRISTRPGIFERPLSIAQATGVVDAWLGAPSAQAVVPGPRHLRFLTDLLRDAGTGGNLTSDAHLAALALEHGAEVITFDADFDRFPGLRWSRPHAPAGN